MLRSMKQILGYHIHARDGEIGHVRDVYFDDASWRTRYLVVDTGTWLPGREVLISPAAIGMPDWQSHTVPVHLTQGQIEESPPITADRPVSRQEEQQLAGFFDWPVYWYGTPMMAPGTVPPAAARDKNDKADPAQAGPPEDPHLRSLREVIGYHIHAEDGTIGHVEDMIGHTDGWPIRYLIVDTKNWLPGRKVLLAPLWAESFSWASREVLVGLTREQIEQSPEFDPSTPVNREYEAHLYDYYGMPTYWEKTTEGQPVGAARQE